MLTFFYKGCIEGEVRIVEGSTLLEGRVEICKNNVWNTVCHGGWTVTDARVVCRQLGFSVSGEKFCRYYSFSIATYLLLVSTLHNFLSSVPAAFFLLQYLGSPSKAATLFCVTMWYIALSLYFGLHIVVQDLDMRD